MTETCLGNLVAFISFIAYPAFMLNFNKKEISLALNGKRILETKTGDIEIVVPEKRNIRVALPKAAVRVLIDALAYISEGRDVVVRPLNDELSTQKAAEFLNVSRPFLIKILEKGEIPYRKVGKHRRVLLSDLQSYRRRVDEKRLKVLDELAAQSQELEMGY